MSSEYRPVLKAMYLVGALLIIYALSEPLLQIWPFRFGEARWRFGAAGLITAALAMVILGVAVLMTVAMLLRHRRTLRTLGLVSAVVAVLLAVMAVMFGLDFLQVRATVNPRVRGSLDLTVMRAIAMAVLSIPTYLVLGLAAWRCGRRSMHAAAANGAGPGLVYRTQTEGAPAVSAGAVPVGQSGRKEEDPG